MSTSAQLIIPDSTKQQFSVLVQMIVDSESMNDEERQYWINILPIMTPDQITNLENILTNEKKQLKAIDEKYAAQVQNISNEELLKKTGAERRARREERASSEQAIEHEEAAEMEDVLKQIENL